MHGPVAADELDGEMRAQHTANKYVPCSFGVFNQRAMLMDGSFSSISNIIERKSIWLLALRCKDSSTQSISRLAVAGPSL